MDRTNLMRVFKKYDCELISAQTVPNTYSEINYSSLCAEQVSNRNSAGWKKANFVYCIKSPGYSLKSCLEGWRSLAMQTQDQVLFIQDESGLLKAYNWQGKELRESIDEIVSAYTLYEIEQ